MKQIASILSEICETPDLRVAPDSPLGQIKGWDSMRAVTFQLALEQLFEVDLSEEMISGSTTLADIEAMLTRKGAQVGSV